jgi:heptosyltransferase-2
MEKDLCENIKNHSGNKKNIHNVAGKITIKELLELLSRTDLTITNCNGVSHLACTTKSRIIGLYGPTDYKITGPKSASFIPVTAGLECAPCYAKDYITGCGDPVCMEEIKVEVVVKIVNDLLR